MMPFSFFLSFFLISSYSFFPSLLFSSYLFISAGWPSISILSTPRQPSGLLLAASPCRRRALPHPRLIHAPTCSRRRLPPCTHQPTRPHLHGQTREFSPGSRMEPRGAYFLGSTSINLLRSPYFAGLRW